MNTIAYNLSLSEDEKLRQLKEGNLGTWYDGWRPYCTQSQVPCKSGLHRMDRMPYGFRCAFCGNMIGFNLHRLKESPLNTQPMKEEKKPENPNAFPVIDHYEDLNEYKEKVIKKYIVNPGMTLRDYFAAKAMQALISYEHSPERNGEPVVTITDICKDSYTYADAMLKAREWANNDVEEDQ